MTKTKASKKPARVTEQEEKVESVKNQKFARLMEAKRANFGRRVISTASLGY